MSKTNKGLRAFVLVSAAALALTACSSNSGGSGTNTGGATNGTSGGPTASGGSAGEGQKGGTINVLTTEKQFLHLDPQRNYTGVDLSFANGYLQRTLTAYKFGAGKDGSELVPDLATDTGQASDDAKTWKFTLRDGATFEDGSPITCADVKYGVSRTFATDIITDGPTYAISMLDIPQAADGTSVYKGPYKADATGQAAFDKAVECSSDNKTITFHLNKPVADFNYTVTLLAFSPVPKAKDDGEKYDDHPVSSGPYKIQQYDKGSKLILVRNDAWKKESDPYRPAYPDKVVVTFGVDPAQIDQRIIADSGEDQTAVQLAGVDSGDLSTIFSDPRYKDRRFDDYDPYVRYLAINVDKVPDVKQRIAIAAALDRQQLLTIAGGKFAGDLADGVIKPNLSLDYKPTNMWDGLLGKSIPATGDPDYAKQLIQESGKPMPTITFDYPQTPTNDKVAGAIVTAEKRAGITVKPNPIEPGQYYGIVLDPKKEHELSSAGWGPDWLNASTVVPELLTPSGGFNLSHYNNKAFNDAVQKAKAETDRTKQGQMWADLNAQAMKDVPVIPTRFGKIQYIVGSKVGGAYIWAPYGGMPFGALYVTK
ncbi:MAG: ABC transporter substrate-binding protein [Actinomycetales bacterium]